MADPIFTREPFVAGGYRYERVEGTPQGRLVSSPGHTRSFDLPVGLGRCTMTFFGAMENGRVAIYSRIYHVASGEFAWFRVEKVAEPVRPAVGGELEVGDA